MCREKRTKCGPRGLNPTYLVDKDYFLELSVQGLSGALGAFGILANLLSEKRMAIEQNCKIWHLGLRHLMYTG